MKTLKQITALLGIIFMGYANAQNDNTIKVSPKDWTVHNREVDFTNNSIHLNAQDGGGMLWLNDADFKNGTIELDIKGKDVRGRSFVGIAFHGLDNNTYDCIYFRPFNFKNPEKKGYSVQYISTPENGWQVLRKNFPGKYENEVVPVPNPDEWFHAKIIVEFPYVKVYVNGASSPSLEIEQISNRKQGNFGLWVGNGSDGYFKNLQVTPK